MATRILSNLDQALRWIAAEYFYPLGEDYRDMRLGCWAIITAHMPDMDLQLQQELGSPLLNTEYLRNVFAIAESTLSRSTGKALSNVKPWTAKQQDLAIRRYNVPDTDYLNTGKMSRFSSKKYVPLVQSRVRVYSQCAILLAIIAQTRQANPLDDGLLADRREPDIILGGGWKYVSNAVTGLGLSKAPMIQYLMAAVKPFAANLQSIPDIDALSQREGSDVEVANALCVAIHDGTNETLTFWRECDGGTIWNMLHSDDFRYVWLQDFQSKPT